jgi:hypothetical protein
LLHLKPGSWFRSHRERNMGELFFLLFLFNRPRVDDPRFVFG